MKPEDKVQDNVLEKYQSRILYNKIKKKIGGGCPPKVSDWVRDASVREATDTPRGTEGAGGIHSWEKLFTG